MTVNKGKLRSLLGRFAKSRFRYIDVKDGRMRIMAVQKPASRASAGAATGREGPLTVPKPSIPSPEMRPPEAMAVTPTTIRSPRVGHFYNVIKEGEPPVLLAGKSIAKGQVIGIIEAMHLKYEVKADLGGVVEELLVENGEAVEYGQPLARLKESSEEA